VSLVQVDRVKVLLTGLKTTSSAEDAAIGTFLDQLEKAAAAWLGYPRLLGTRPTLEETSYTRYLDGTGTVDLHLDVLPLTSVDPADYVFEVDTSREFDGSTYLVDSGDYRIEDHETGLVHLLQGIWTSGHRVIKVTYTAGYTTTSIRDTDVELGIAMIVQDAWQGRRSQGKAARSRRGGGSAAYLTPEAWPEKAQQYLGSAALPMSVA
jgi:hypothetical protein